MNDLKSYLNQHARCDCQWSPTWYSSKAAFFEHVGKLYAVIIGTGKSVEVTSIEQLKQILG